jgi:hypothetical protein
MNSFAFLGSPYRHPEPAAGLARPYAQALCEEAP